MNKIWSGLIHFYRNNRRVFSSLAFLSPAIILAAIFFYIPLIRVFQMSFFEWSLLGDKEFLLFQNYSQLFQDPEFWQSLWNTFIYTIIVTPMIFVPAVILALILNRKLKGVTFFRSVYFLPVTLSFIVASYVWVWIYNDTYGILNYILQTTNIIEKEIAWLNSTWLGRFSVSLMIAWKTTGFSMVILLAGLQGIPERLYEAASVNGANLWQKHRYVTLPLVRPTFALALILSVAGSFKAFDHFLVMTGGGPYRSTQTIVMYLQKVGFQQFNLGYGASISVIFLAIVLIISSFELRIGGFQNE